MPKIHEQIRDLPVPAKDRAGFKGLKISELVKSVPRTNIKFSGADYDIEILETKAIPNGIEVLARAYQPNGEQIGFGKDGSVDIERFRIFNPPIFVDDPLGDIILESVNVDGSLAQRKLKEDPQRAILESLSHTISVKKQKFNSGRIVKEKIGSTTSTFNPDADPESTSVDGSLNREGVNLTFAGIRDGAGTGAAPSATTATVQQFNDGVGTSWDLLFRSMFLFDTSSLPDGDTIDSATFSLFGSSKGDAGTATTPNVALVSAAPASNTDLVAADYNVANFGTTEFATRITFANWSTTAYNDFALNASGLSNISKTGVSKFGCRNGQYDLDNSAPTASGAAHGTAAHAAEGTTGDPKLVVEHSVGATIQDPIYGGIVPFPR